VLGIAKLEKYASMLDSEGYDEVGDLEDADDEDLLAIGLKKPELNRLRKALAGESKLSVRPPPGPPKRLTDIKMMRQRKLGGLRSVNSVDGEANVSTDSKASKGSWASGGWADSGDSMGSASPDNSPGVSVDLHASHDMTSSYAE
jgi:hypothetical protein